MKLVLGMAVAAVMAVAVPGIAKAVEVEAPGVRVDIGEGRHHHHGWRHDRGWHAYGRARCETITIRKRVRGALVVRHIRRCGRHHLP